MDRDIHYYIVEEFGDVCTVYSQVETSYAGPAINYVCEGSRQYCETVLNRLERENDV